MKDFTATNAEFESIDISEKFQVSESGAIGGVIPSGINDIIKWDGSQWIAGINPGGNGGNGGGGGGSGVADPFTTNLISGQSLQNISFNQTLDSAPSIATDLEIDGDGSIIPYTISGLSTTGYTAIFAEEIPNNNYKIHTVFGGGSSSGGGELSGEELRAINKTIVDSPVDVFVYDTSRDSDGGAWRKRTQHTSWYNEELNTATRGARREFPAVAVIVAEADKVTIYDGDDPDLGMWMVINQIGSWSNIFFSCLYCLNGKLVIGSGSGYTDVCFIKERMSKIHPAAEYTGDYIWNELTYNPLYVIEIPGLGIVNNVINDVAMTVLPNAPIDENTGLPVPTIAVATDGGVSVIKDDGTVVNSDETNKVRTVHFNKNELLISTLVDFDNVRIYSFSSSIDKLYEYWAGSSDGFWHLANAHNSTYSSIFTENTSANILGLTKFDLEKNKNDSSMCYITSKYNTGWMPGDIKLAALSDSVVENVGVSSDELISNNKFGTGTEPTGWLTHLGTSTIVNNQAVLDGSGVTDANLITEINCVVGKMYEFNIDSFRSSGSNTYDISVSTGSGSLFHQSVIKGVNKNNTSIETTTIRFVATQATHYVGVKCNGSPSNAVITIDNAYARQITELITNGDFSTDSDWTKGTGWSIVGGVASKVSSADSSNLTQEIDCVIGQTYVVSWDITSRDSSAVGFYTQSGGSITAVQNYYESVGSYSKTFTATSESVTIALRAGSTAFLSVDNISVRPAEEDRSVNSNGLQIVGEIQKTPVAPGADLVAYSGFSENDYLVQPYNADLDFGTGDFCVMGWANVTDNRYNYIFDRRFGGPNGFNTGFALAIDQDGRLFGACRENSEPLLVGSVVAENVWNHFCFLRKNGITYLYQNAILENSEENSYNVDAPSGTVLRIGVKNQYGVNGSIALLRISATAPTDEQIAKIYRDEKVLFQEGAQSTLYGTSDAVTALAYDDSEQLLHVGTASGRSDFRGLARVNNTTTAISNSISAAEGTIIQN